MSELVPPGYLPIAVMGRTGDQGAQRTMAIQIHMLDDHPALSSLLAIEARRMREELPGAEIQIVYDLAVAMTHLSPQRRASLDRAIAECGAE